MSRQINLENCWQLSVGLMSNLHQKGRIPYSYHTDENGQRQQHYAATMVATTALMFVPMIIVVGTYVFPKWDKLDNHQVAASMTLVGIAAVAAGVIGGLMIKTDGCRLNKILSLLNISKDRSSMDRYAINNDIPMQAMTERTSLVHPNSYFPSRLSWMLFGGLFAAFTAALALISMIDPTLFFNDIANSEFGHYGAVVTGATTAALLTGGIATLFHCLGAKRTQKCQETVRVDDTPVIEI